MELFAEIGYACAIYDLPCQAEFHGPRIERSQS